MFTTKAQDDKSGLDKAIDNVLSEMAGFSSDSDEYSKMMSQLVKLHDLKATHARKQLSPDTLAIVIGNLVGIILIVGHEQAHVVTSKALQFVLKLR